MSKQKLDTALRSILARHETDARQLKAEVNDLKARLSSLEAWLLDKEHSGLPVRAFIQRVGSEEFLTEDKRWVGSLDGAVHFSTSLNALYYCRTHKVSGVRILLEIGRTNGVAMVPLDLAELA